MHIEIRFSKHVLTAIFFLFAFATFSQHKDSPDTINRKPFERYWTKPRFVPRIGGGVQDGPFVEAGIAFHKIYVHPIALASSSPYLTLEGVILKDDYILGAKAGYEVVAGLFGVAADVTYYTDFEKRSLMITPKAGLSVFGFVNLFYGYNIPLSDDEFKSIDKNRFSLTFNFNRDYFSVRTAQKRREHYRKQDARRISD
jgi:hypothetical protein